MTQMIDATTDPQLANSLVAGALSNDTDSAPVAPPPQVTPPHDRHVTLLAGIINPIEGSHENEAVVRELTGADEEALTSPTLARSVSKYLQALVARGTETIGGAKVTAAQHEGLLIGDRELLVLAIRRATYGPLLEGVVTTCPFCADRDEDYSVPLDDIEVKQLDNVNEAIFGFTLTLPSGIEALVRFATAGDQDALVESGAKKTEGELNTMMLSRTVQRLNDQSVYSDQQVRGLSMRDRRFLLKEIDDRAPGPKIGEVKRTCRACEQEFGLNLGLLDIFRP